MIGARSSLSRSPGQGEPDLRGRADTVLAEAAEAGLAVRLFGGLAVIRLLGERQPEACRRQPGDIDLAAPRSAARPLSGLLERCGFAPDRQFNTLHGAERLLFCSADGVKVDVALDVLRMCHPISLAPAFSAPGSTLPPWLLLLTKLQVHELSVKDVLDASALLAGCDDGELAVDEIADLCAGDWGLWRSVTGSLAAILEGPPGLCGPERRRLDSEAARLRAALEGVPKTLRWRMRARIGERVRWYELPEEP